MWYAGLVTRTSTARTLAQHPRSSHWRATCGDKSHASFGLGAVGKGPAQQAPRRRPTSTLWTNFGEATDRDVARHSQRLCVLVPERTGQEPDGPTLPEETSASPWRSRRFANRIGASHASVHALLEVGHNPRPIARQPHTSHRTVKGLAGAGKPEGLFLGQWQHDRTFTVDEYKPYLDDHWNEVCTNHLETLGGNRPSRLQRQLWHRHFLYQEEARLKVILANCPELKP